MLEFYLYSAFKVFHLGCLVFWLGPTLGSWWILINARKSGSATTIKHIYPYFLQTLWLEHIALIGLLASGAAMASIYSVWGQNWLIWKLVIICSIIIPLELVDIYIGNFKLPARIKQNKVGKMEHFYHGPFTTIAMLVLPPAVLAILILATTKLPI